MEFKWNVSLLKKKKNPSQSIKTHKLLKYFMYIILIDYSYYMIFNFYYINKFWSHLKFQAYA